MRNFACALMLAQGVPMLLMGDEYGHTKGGNNNTYCHDTELNWFDWDHMTRNSQGYGRFWKSLIKFRCVGRLACLTERHTRAYMCI